MKDGDLTADNVRYPWATTAEQWWNYAVTRPWFAGAMVWAGFDYRGESVWPATVNNFGVMDLCGFPKASYWYYKANWTDEDVLNVWPRWTPSVTNLYVDTNCDEVELFINGRSVGRRRGDSRRHLPFAVRYEPGTVAACGTRGGREVRFAMATVAEAVGLVVSPDRTDLRADGVDATVVNVQAVDADGRHADECGDLLMFRCEGSGRIIGVGNGDPLSHEDDICPDGRWYRRLYNGKCQFVVWSGIRPGTLRVHVSSSALKPAAIEIKLSGAVDDDQK